MNLVWKIVGERLISGLEDYLRENWDEIVAQGWGAVEKLFELIRSKMSGKPLMRSDGDEDDPHYMAVSAMADQVIADTLVEYGEEG
jgi:hypothetical protein